MFLDYPPQIDLDSSSSVSPDCPPLIDHDPASKVVVNKGTVRYGSLESSFLPFSSSVYLDYLPQ